MAAKRKPAPVSPIPVHHLPPAVIARCAATTGTYGGCHGADASGIRMPSGAATDNEWRSLAELETDMRLTYEKWADEQARVGGAA